MAQLARALGTIEVPAPLSLPTFQVEEPLQLAPMEPTVVPALCEASNEKVGAGR